MRSQLSRSSIGSDPSASVSGQAREDAGPHTNIVTSSDQTDAGSRVGKVPSSNSCKLFAGTRRPT